MTSDTQPSVIDTTSGTTSSQAALIATFYSDREVAPMLHEQLYRSLEPKPEAIVPKNWQDPVSGKRLYCFDPSAIAAHDATIIQLVQTAPGNPTTGWKTMRRQLENILASSPGNWWGYTLTYQASLTPDSDEDQALKELLPAVRRLRSPETLHPLVKADMSGGRVWLLGLPAKGGGLAAATVYVALSPREKADDLVSKVLYGRAAWLLVPDLIVHKSYFQKRQYSDGDLLRRYREKVVRPLTETTDQLLENLAQQEQPLSNLEQQNGSLSSLDQWVEEGRQRQIEIAELLDDLAPAYYPLARYLSYLNMIHIALKRQLYNYDRWQAELKDNDIIEYHRAHLEAIKEDLEMLVSEGRCALETADKAVSMARVQIDKIQVRIDKAQESKQREADKEHQLKEQEAERKEQEADKAQQRNQQLIQTLLTIVAAALALPELIDKDLAGWLLGVIPILEQSKDNISVQFVTQIILIAIFAIPIWLIVRWLLRKQREGQTEDEERTDSDGE